MPELPEIYNRAKEMQELLTGRTITGIEVLQPKCLNVPVEEFTRALCGATIQGTTYRGKWLFTRTSQGYLLLNMGMGGELLLADRAHLPEKRRLVFDLDSPQAGFQPCLSVNFWWFGYAHYVPADALDTHPMSAKLGPNAIDLTADLLKQMFAGQRTRLKTFLLDQTRIAGIGNAYIHDILFLARLHPLRKIDTLSEAEIEALAGAIQAGLRPSLEKGGAFYEPNLRGEKGGFLVEDILIGYRAGTPCPKCGTPIEKLKTGSTTSYLCPTCQV